MTIEDVDNVQQTHHSTLPALFLIFTTVFLLFLAARSPLERNQEARVLETAREMLHAPLIQWAVPRINGEIRVNKPPLAYWLSACSMKIFGETPFAGRVPFVFVVTATLWMIYRLGAREFSRATGQMAMWMTLGTTLYASYGILAETDAISVLFVTAGIWAINRSAESEGLGARVLNLAIAGAMAGLAAMAKGPPAFFIPAYTIILAIVERRWRLLGLPLLSLVVAMAAIGAPWWVMVAKNPQYNTVLTEELTRMRTGSNHGKPFWLAFALAGAAVLPYIAPALGMTVCLKMNKGVKRCLIWFGIGMITLAVTPQKQDHYFFQIVPPVMLMAAYFIELGYSDETRSGKAYRIASGAVGGTALGAAIVSPTFVVIASMSSRGVGFDDVALTVVAAILFGKVFLGFLKKDQSHFSGVFLTLLLTSFGMQAIMHLWEPTFKSTFKMISAELKKNGLDESVVFYPQANFRLNFELRKIIPVVEDSRKLQQMLEENPGMSVVIEKENNDFQIPPFLETRLEYPNRGKGMVVGTLKKP